MSEPDTAQVRRNENVLIWGLAISHVIAIGCLFHSFTLFLRPLNEQFGWTSTQMTAAFALGMFTADLIAIPVGQWVDRRGGHLVMSLGATFAAINLAMWSRVETLTGFYIIWICMGIAIGCTLGNSAASVIAANTRDYKRGLTYISIVAGFSSTVVVPVVGYLLTEHGWRTALIGLAVMQFLGPGLINTFLLRGTVGSRTAEFKRKEASRQAGRPSGFATEGVSPLRTALGRPAFWFLAIAASVHWFVITAVNVHLMPLLYERGFDVKTAVTVFALQGPAAVAGRLALLFLDRNGTAKRQGRIAFPFFGLGILILTVLAPLGMVWLVAYSIVYGMAQGVLLIVRQAVIAEIFGLRGYGAIAGALTTVAILPRTCSPLAVSLMHDGFGSYEPVLWVIFGLIIVGTVGFFIATSDRLKDRG